MGVSPGLVVMGGNSYSKGHGFKSLHRILDEYFFTFICCKNCNVCLKKRPGRPIFFKKDALDFSLKEYFYSISKTARLSMAIATQFGQSKHSVKSE